MRDNAERRAYGRMGHFKVLTEGDPQRKLVVMGCLAEQDRDRMQKIAPHVDAVFGTKELRALGDQLAAWQPDFDDVDFTDDAALLALGGSADAVVDAFSHLRAFVNVQRGCSYYCTFCIVPQVRGRFDHRPASGIVHEVREKIAGGAREVMLVGQTVNAWKDPATGADFGDLCKEVAALPGVERLTFISPHPKDFTEKMIADLAQVPQMNPRAHLPLQSFSDPILRRMNRKYTAAQFREKVDLIRRYLPDWAITTDIIVGFPGESEADFDATARLRRDRRLCQRIHLYLLDPARDAGRALGASPARGRFGAIRPSVRRTKCVRPAPITIARSAPRCARWSADRRRKTRINWPLRRSTT